MSARIHVVDDDDSFRTAIERRLKLAGYEVATYPSAQQLLDRLPDEDEPGCILLDVRKEIGERPDHGIAIAPGGNGVGVGGRRIDS